MWHTSSLNTRIAQTNFRLLGFQGAMKEAYFSFSATFFILFERAGYMLQNNQYRFKPMFLSAAEPFGSTYLSKNLRIAWARKVLGAIENHQTGSLPKDTRCVLQHFGILKKTTNLGTNASQASFKNLEDIRANRRTSCGRNGEQTSAFVVYDAASLRCSIRSFAVSATGHADPRGYHWTSRESTTRKKRFGSFSVTGEAVRIFSQPGCGFVPKTVARYAMFVLPNAHESLWRKPCSQTS